MAISTRLLSGKEFDDSSGDPSRRTPPSAPRRVLHLIGSNGVGGPEKQILHHAADLLSGPIANTDTALSPAPWQILVGSFHDLPTYPEILSEAEARQLPTVCLPGGMHPRLIHTLAATVAHQRIDLLCTHGFKANVLGYLASRCPSTPPHIAFLRGWTAETLRVRFYEALERQALARARTVVCVSPRQAVEVARLRRHRPAPLVIENAMLPPFTRSGLPPAPSRTALGIPGSAVVFGCAGRLSAEKGHRYLLEAFATLAHSSAPGAVFLLLVGDGREQTTLQQQALRLGIRALTHFAGFQGNCADWMAHMDCLVQPSLTEGTPNSVLEALCLGLPVLATAVGGVPALITDRINGLLVPAADAQALSDAMREIVTNPALRAAIIAGAAQTRDQYSPATQRSRLLQLYGQHIS